MHAFVKPQRALTLLSVCIMVSLFAAPGEANQAAQDQPTQLGSGLTLLGQPKITTGSDDALTRISPDVLREAEQAPADGTVGIIIVSDGPLADTQGLQSAAKSRPDTNGLAFTSAKIAPSMLPKIASASNIIAVLSNKPPEIPPLPEPEYARQYGSRGSGVGGRGSRGIEASKPIPDPQPLTPDSWHTVDIHHVRDAWAQGYRGNGVKVALLDSGVDFGHPDLQNTFARVDDPASPYYGWPYVVDPYSIELLAQGIIHNVPEAIQGYGSWFVDTSTTVHGAQANFTTVTALPSGMNPITHTYTLPGTSRSGTYHMGIHPDEHLAFDLLQEYPAVLVADTVTPGVYDTVYVDLNDNYDFRDDTPMRKGSELSTRDVNGDGLADISGGLLYFIADGRRPIPASDWLYGLVPPGNGDLVALYGSMDYGEDHGTFCASSIVAQGRIDGQTPLRPPYKPSGVGGMVQGMAPGAKIVAIGNIYRSGMSLYNAFLLAALGLDGRPNSGDEAQIASMSFGQSGGWNNGWDFMSRYLLYLSLYNPQLAWMAATGNGGPGYGTVTPPASSPAAIAVGAATQYGETVTFDTISSTNRITWGDVQPWSNRGPSQMGQPKPDVVAVGAWGTGDVPINMVPQNGSIAYDIWGGTSMSTPVGAGITALLYQAYKARTGSWPSAETARTILKSSATDLNYGVFTQGAGMLDALKAVQLARGRAGAVVSPSLWVPGSTSAGYLGVVQAGDTNLQIINIQNPTTATLSARITGEYLTKTSEYQWSVPISNSKESSPDFSRPDYLWPMNSHIPPDTDLLRVSAVVSYSQFSLADPRLPFLGASSAWRLLAYDWQDDSGDGAVWRDLNGNGVVNAGEEERGEFNRFSYSYDTNDIVNMDIEKPLQRSHDGLLIGLQHRIKSAAIPTSTVRLKVITYKKQAWSWLTTPSGLITIPPGQTISVQVSSHIPAGTPPGAYEGDLAVTVGSGPKIIVPVAVNVEANSLGSTLGGANRPAAGTPFDNGRVSGDQNWDWRPEAGEWRHFYLNNTTPPGPNTFLWAGLTWRNFPTDFDVIIGGPTPWDWFSQRFPALFGPHGIDGLAASAWTNLGTGGWQWHTATDTTEEWVTARLGQTGAHEVVLHNVFFSGLADSESYTATLGTVQLSQDYVNITSRQPSASAIITMTTNMDLPGIKAQAYGLSQQRTWPNISILPGQSWFTETNVSDVATVEFSTQAPDDTDVDLFVDHFENGRYVWYGASTGPTGNEFVRIEPAPPGNYRLRVEAAVDAPNPAHFDLSINAIQGTDMSVSPSVITNTVHAGTTLTFTVGYNRPTITDGVWQGRLFLGPYKAPALHSLPVTVYYGDITPSPTPTPQVCRSRFTDVPTSYWAYPYINDLYCRGIVSGYQDDTFRPGGQASRVQFVKMLVLGMGWPFEHPASPTFVDVPELSWGYEVVETAHSHGIVGGYADGTFRPSNPITRGQLAKMLVLARGWPLLNPTMPTFTDVPRTSSLYTYIETAVSRGLISGYANHTFRPNLEATRGQLSKMLYLAMNAPLQPQLATPGR